MHIEQLSKLTDNDFIATLKYNIPKNLINYILPNIPILPNCFVTVLNITTRYVSHFDSVYSHERCGLREDEKK